MLSEVLLHELRVVDARSVILELGSQRRALFTRARRAVLHYVLEGVVDITAEGMEETIRLAPGEWALLLYGDRHCLNLPSSRKAGETKIVMDTRVSEAPTTIHVGSHLSGAAILSSSLDMGYMAPAAFVNRVVPVCWATRPAARGSNIAAVLSLDPSRVRSACQGIGGTAFATNFVSLLLVQAIRETYEQYWQSRDVEVRSPSTRRISVALHKMHMHLDRNWSLAELARETGLSRSAFCAIFREHIGRSPASYLTQVRMARAAQLLNVEGMSLHEVSRRVGYRLESSFARAFRQRYGSCPRSYAAKEAQQRRSRARGSCANEVLDN
ncbi:MAG: AraC family transcriptional regulator [Steroidobacteraceae bacterium]